MDNSTENIRHERKKPKGIWLIVALLLLVFLLLGLLSTVFLANRQVNIFSSASVAGIGEVDLENSYIFASPLKASSGGEKIRITVFILDSEGKGVFGKTVSLGENPALQIVATQEVTDATGRAIFDISSNTRGLYLIQASYDGIEIPQTVQINFL